MPPKKKKQKSVNYFLKMTSILESPCFIIKLLLCDSDLSTFSIQKSNLLVSECFFVNINCHYYFVYINKKRPVFFVQIESNASTVNFDSSTRKKQIRRCTNSKGKYFEINRSKVKFSINFFLILNHLIDFTQRMAHNGQYMPLDRRRNHIIDYIKKTWLILLLGTILYIVGIGVLFTNEVSNRESIDSVS